MKNSVEINETIKPFNKSINIEGDKSLSIRWALIASQASGKSKAFNLLKSEDVLNTLNCLKKLGIKIKFSGKSCEIFGEGLNSFKYRKNIILSNIKLAFPKKNEEETNKIYKGFKLYFLNLIWEIIKMFSSSKEFYKKRIKVSNMDLINDYYQNNKSVIIIGGHYNNWEWAGPILSQIGNHHFVSVYKKLSNNFFNNFMIKLRSRFDIDVFEYPLSR